MLWEEFWHKSASVGEAYMNEQDQLKKIESVRSLYVGMIAFSPRFWFPLRYYRKPTASSSIAKLPQVFGIVTSS